MPAFMNEVSPNTDARHQGRLAYAGADLLPPETAGLLWEKARESSLLLRLGRQVPVGYGETIVNAQTVQPEVGQVGVGTRPQDREGYRKPVSGIAWSASTFGPIKLATIVTASEEFARANPQQLFSSLGTQMAQAMGRGVDLAAFQNKRPDNGAALLGTSLNSSISAAATTVYDGVSPLPLDEQIAAAWAKIVAYGAEPDAIAVDPLFVPTLITARDALGNRLFQNSFDLTGGGTNSIGGLRVERGSAVSGRVGASTDSLTRAVVGDFNRLVFGYADGVRLKVTDQGSIESGDGTSVNLWQTNQVAILIEATFGWLVDPNAFQRLSTDNSPAGPAYVPVPAGETGEDITTNAPLVDPTP
jgi:HK97 family phage major capsid protein